MADYGTGSGINQYSIILASDIGDTANDTTSGSLFARVNNVRAVHAASALQAGKISSTSPLNTHFNTQVATIGDLITPSVVSALKELLTSLYTNSPYVTTDFGSGISVPLVGSLITKSLFDTMETSIRNVEGVSSANTTFNSGHYAFNGTSYDSGNYSYDGTSYDSGNYNYDSAHRSTYDSTYDSSYNGSRFCGSFSASDRGYCRSDGYR